MGGKEKENNRKRVIICQVATPSSLRLQALPKEVKNRGSLKEEVGYTVLTLNTIPLKSAKGNIGKIIGRIEYIALIQVH